MILIQGGISPAVPGAGISMSSVLTCHVTLWVAPSSALVPRKLSDFSGRRISLQRGAKLLSARRQRVIWTGIDARDEGSGNGEKDDKKANRDWDSSWNEFNEKRKGGVFRLEEKSTPQAGQKFDQRTERLTSAWSNDTSFLVGIGVIGLIAAFYIYVYANGGIS